MSSAFFRFPLRVLSCCFALALTACSEPPSLTLREKADFVAELIDSRPECKVHREKLLKQQLDAQGIAQVYQDAKATFCLKPDV